MLPQELLKKVRQIELTTQKRVGDLLSGQYKSHFKGQGVQFSEHRLYMPGDDVRHIDWKVSARAREPVIKKFEEERERSVFLVIDVSASQSFGSTQKLKAEVTAELAGFLACVASRSGDQVGALLFGAEVEKMIPLKRGQQHVLRIIRDVLEASSQSPGSNLAGALEKMQRMMKHRGILFILSDFLIPESTQKSPHSSLQGGASPSYQSHLKRLAHYHDVVALQIVDQQEKQVPDLGQLLWVNPETGEEQWINSSRRGFQEELSGFWEQTHGDLRKLAQLHPFDLLELSLQEDYIARLMQYFRARGRKPGRRVVASSKSDGSP